MVKERKPMFVSGEAHALLQQKAQEDKMFMGDVVDILLGLKTTEQIKEENKSYFNDKATI